MASEASSYQVNKSCIDEETCRIPRVPELLANPFVSAGNPSQPHLMHLSSTCKDLQDLEPSTCQAAKLMFDSLEDKLSKEILTIPTKTRV